MSDNDKTGTIRVVSAVADKTQVVLYKEDGSTVILKQGDHRLEALLNEVIPITTRGEVAVISLEKFSVYADFEKQSGGVVRFVKTARKALGSMLGDHGTKEVVVINMEFTPDITAPQLTNLLDQVEGYVMPYVKENEAAKVDEPAHIKAQIGDQVRLERHAYLPDGWYTVSAASRNPTDPQRLQVNAGSAARGNIWVMNECVKAWRAVERSDPTAPAAVLVAVDLAVGDEKTPETILQRLEPMSSTEDAVAHDEIVVAVIGNMMIPDIEKLKPLILHAAKTNSIQSVQNFLVRAAAIVSKRVHSVVDLMRFLEKGDLPLAEDGSIIAYKVLKRKAGEPGFYVDCHTGNVKQRVGSYVMVDESLVDTDRRNECSNGLHIARRGYIGGFNGDICVLCKIDPEDVMVVPHGDPNKVRVKGYHILNELSDEAFRFLKHNRPMTSEQITLLQVRDAITGNHIRRIEEVRIRAQKGGNVLITPIDEPVAAKRKPASKKVVLTKKEIQQTAALDDATNIVGTVEPKEINRRVNAEIAKTTVKSKAGKSGVPPMGQVATEKVNKDNKPAKTPANKSEAKSQNNNGKSSDKPVVKEAVKAASKPAGKDNSPDQSRLRDEFRGLPPEQREALSLLWSGVSQSESSRKTGVSRRTIGRLTDKFGTSALT